VDILLTWSGVESHEIAAFFRKWLPEVLPGTQPWISSADIAKGRKWFDELMGQLEKTRVSLTFVTPGNVRSPWVYYEVGAIAAKIGGGIVCPYLVGVEGKHVKDTPLGQFQWTEANKADTWKMIQSINEGLATGHSETVLEGNFNSQWPKLKRQIDKVLETLAPVEDEVTDVDPSIEERLTEDARRLLVEASQNISGRMIYDPTMARTTLGIKGENHVNGGDNPRLEARLRGALNELVEFALVEPIGYEGELFEVSRRGYEVADRIKDRTS
jgi:hypothetical protein